MVEFSFAGWEDWSNRYKLFPGAGTFQIVARFFTSVLDRGMNGMIKFSGVIFILFYSVF